MMKTQDTVTVREVYRAVWIQCHVSQYELIVCTQYTIMYYADVAISLFSTMRC